MFSITRDAGDEHDTLRFLARCRQPFAAAVQISEVYFMPNRFTSLFTLSLASLIFSSSSIASSRLTLHDSLLKAAPQLDQQVLGHALDAVQCASLQDNNAADRLAVIDFSLPSSEKRLWIFDLKKRQLLLNDFVAHGAKSGENVASNFSNINGSHQSSIGLFRSSESYRGKHGYSLRMDGLEPGFNDLARERAIVIHGADYVNPAWINSQGRIGRSQGCPAVRPEITKQVVDSLKDGQLVFTWYPDPEWLANSTYLNCSGPRLANRTSKQKHAGDS